MCLPIEGAQAASHPLDWGNSFWPLSLQLNQVLNRAKATKKAVLGNEEWCGMPAEKAIKNNYWPYLLLKGRFEV